MYATMYVNVFVLFIFCFWLVDYRKQYFAFRLDFPKELRESNPWGATLGTTNGEYRMLEEFIGRVNGYELTRELIPVDSSEVIRFHQFFFLFFFYHFVHFFILFPFEYLFVTIFYLNQCAFKYNR